MQKPTRLYNVMFPVWFLLLYPLSWLIVLPVNFAVDTLVLWLCCRWCRLSFPALFKKKIWFIWLFGFLADIVGAFFLLVSQFIPDPWWLEHVSGPVSYHPFSDIWAFLYVLFAMAVASLLIYVLNRRITFRNLDADRKVVHRISLVIAVATTPITFLLPTVWFYSPWYSGGVPV